MPVESVYDEDGGAAALPAAACEDEEPGQQARSVPCLQFTELDVTLEHALHKRQHYTRLRSIPCTKGAKTLSTNSYSLLSQRALAQQRHAKTMHTVASSRQAVCLGNSFSSSSGIAAQARDRVSSAFAMAADSCMYRVRLRRIKHALQRWRRHALSSAPAPAGRPRPKLLRQSRLRARGLACSSSCSWPDDEPGNPPADEGFDRSLEAEGAAQIVSLVTLVSTTNK